MGFLFNCGAEAADHIVIHHSDSYSATVKGEMGGMLSLTLAAMADWNTILNGPFTSIVATRWVEISFE